MVTVTREKIINAQVSVIPAKKRHLQNGDQFRSQSELRVAAYCRVSTDEESQETSYTAQVNYYTNLIASRPGWTLAGIYADEGKTGTTRKGRIYFNQLIADAKDGKVDYIITKSISRFARNTVDALDCVHELQCLRPPVGIYFERENIDTLNANSEMFLTFYCSMAQEESRSISENIKWSLQKNFRSGKPQINLKRMLGYDMCRNGNWIINEAEAGTVCCIYGRFLEGISANGIARELNEAGCTTVNGKVWRADAVLRILRNEKYAGDVIMQKTYTESFLTHKAVKNTGEVPQYYLENHHPAIVDRDTWNKVQELLMFKQRGRKHLTRKVQAGQGEVEICVDDRARNTQEACAMQADFQANQGCPAKPFAILTCSECGEKMKRYAYNAYLKDYTDERSHEGKQVPPEEADYVDSFSFSYGVYKCPSSRGKNRRECNGCNAVSLPEVSIQQSFMEMIYLIKRDVARNGSNAEIMVSFMKVYNVLCRKKVDSGFIQRKIKLLDLEITEIEKNYRITLERMQTASYAASIQIGPEILEDSGSAYAKLAEDLKKRLAERCEEKNRLLGERSMAEAMKNRFDAFLTDLAKLPDKNYAGMPVKVNGFAEDGSVLHNEGGCSRSWHKRQYDCEKLEITGEAVEMASDLIPFDEHLFRTHILRMEAVGDEVRYGTTFGLTLTSMGNSRPIKSYIGYRIARKSGAVNIITKMEQLATGTIQHHWKPRKVQSTIIHQRSGRTRY